MLKNEGHLTSIKNERSNPLQIFCKRKAVENFVVLV